MVIDFTTPQIIRKHSKPKKLDVCLVQPPDRFSANPKMYFPLSLCYLASIIRGHGYSVQIMDFREEVGEIPEAKFYGFSCATNQIDIAKELASQVNGITMVGGSHATLLPNDCKNFFDYVVRGEGEQIIVDILEGNVRPGISYAPRIKDLNNIPYPAWDLFEESFSDTLFPGERYGKGELATTIIGSRGCPFKCHFCGNLYNSPVIFRSVANILGELKQLTELGVYHVRFEDDNFTLHPEFERLCRGIKELGVKYKCHTRSNFLVKAPYLADIMYHSGCVECGLGVESADDKVLEVNNKKTTSEANGKAIDILKESGVLVKAYMMAGLPGETEATTEINKQFFTKHKPDKWTLSTFNPYPGCAIFNQPGRFGIEIIDFNWGKWGNFVKDRFNHILIGQTMDEMWSRYQEMYQWFKSETWKGEHEKRTPTH